MSKGDTYVVKTEKFLEELSKKLNFETVDVEFVKEGSEHYLRVYCDMDKEGGITIDDCVAISREISDWLDKTDFIDESYILEVSSPGLGRTLKKDKDFLRETGKKVEIKLYKAVDKRKDFTGILKSFDDKNITIEENSKEIQFLRKDIAHIRLSIED